MGHTCPMADCSSPEATPENSQPTDSSVGGNAKSYGSPDRDERKLINGHGLSPLRGFELGASEPSDKSLGYSRTSLRDSQKQTQIRPAYPFLQ